MPKARAVLDDDELETILAVARNGQSGRITRYEVEELVRGYREMLALEVLALTGKLETE